jgi:hypothetical protein
MITLNSDGKFSVVSVNGSELYFSYKTLVGIRTSDGTLHVSQNYWSNTTAKHLTKIDGGSKEAKDKRLTKEDFQKPCQFNFAYSPLEFMARNNVTIIVPSNPMNTIDIKLRDYLRPGGIKSYSSLIPDLENAFNAGHTVYLWSVPGFLMLAGHPDLKSRPWSDGKDLWYKSAKDALNYKNGKK